MAQSSIEHHAAIGDMRTLGLVSTDGSLDFLCFPEFDSPSVFARLLDQERGGSFCIHPELDHYGVRQLYMPDTNIVVTRFLHNAGIAELTDFMPVRGVKDKSQIIRIVEAVRGKIAFDADCAPAFDYGRSSHRAELVNGAVLFTPETGPRLRLRATVPLQVNAGVQGRPSVTAHFELQAGERAVFILESAEDGEESGRGDAAGIHADVLRVFQPTVRFWQSWMSQSQYTGRWREMVNRSALALKLLTSRAHGSLLAAPTFSLPEKTRRGAQLGLPVCVAPGLVLHDLRVHPPWLHAGGARLQDVAPRSHVGRRGARPVAAHVPRGWNQGAARDHARASQRLPGLAARSRWQRRPSSAPAGHLRRAHGRDLPVREVRRHRGLRRVARRAAHRDLGERTLAGPGRGIWEVRSGGSPSCIHA